MTDDIDILAMPGCEALTTHLIKGLNAGCGKLEARRFPDGESYIRLLSDVVDKDIVLVATLDHPDNKTLPLLFAARAAREIGAASVGLVCPYLPYMRQDCRFKDGEAVTSRQFAELLSECFDWLVTVDPHLHRWTSLSDIYTIPATVVHAAPTIAKWVSEKIDQPLLIGPDEESEQWVSEIAAIAGLDYLVCEKRRLGDLVVEIDTPDLTPWLGRTPVIVDDVISTARTMIQVVKKLTEAGMAPPVCASVHGIFSEDSHHALLDAGVVQIVTCNTIPHETNALDVSDDLIPAVRDHVSSTKNLRR